MLGYLISWSIKTSLSPNWVFLKRSHHNAQIYFDIRRNVVKRPKNQINTKSCVFDRFVKNDKFLIKFLEFVLLFGKCFGLAIIRGRSETLLLYSCLDLKRILLL